MKHSSLLSLAGIIALTGSVIVPARAESVGENFNPIGYDVYLHYNNFSTNNQLADPLITEEYFAGTQWQTFAFTRSVDSYLCTGFRDADVKIIPKIFTTSTVDENYFKGLVHVQYAVETDPYEHSMKMFVSTSPDFTSSDTQECEMVCKTGGGGEYYFFDIPERSSQDYYKFEIDVPQKGPKDGWFQISEIFLYKDGDRVKINLDNDKKLCNIIALKGDLHVKASEYNSSGTIVNEDLTRSPNRAEDQEWTNKVADQDVVYSLPFPTTTGNYMVIRAKSVGASGIHSPEKTITINSSGLVTSIQSPVIDESSESSDNVEWFDIAGRKHSAPVPGLNIQRKGSESKRLIVR